jgi:hypothetical protein
MQRMQTRTDSSAPSPIWLDPFGSWDAAAQWNAIAAQWLTKGWHQWLQFVTVGQVGEAPAAKGAIPAAHAASTRPPRKRAARAHAGARPARSRG